VKDAAVAGEDPRFYEHGGIDLQGTVRAAVTTATGRETQGGSSIARQYVKNVRVQECERMAADEEERAGCYDKVPRRASTASSRRCASRSASRSATRRTRSCWAT
jgi:membrane peptidoglycan carboxypeptidase